MDLLATAERTVINITEQCDGIKALILDEDTTGIVSSVSSFTEIQRKGIFVIRSLKDRPVSDSALHLRGIALLRPTPANIASLEAEIANPHYREYHLFFTEPLSSAHLETLAKADAMNEVIKTIKECYLDFFPVNSEFFELRTPSVIVSSQANAKDVVSQSSYGLSSLLISIGKRPIIRYQKDSDLSRAIAHSVTQQIQATEFAQTKFNEESPFVLVIDRKSDLLTPLLFSWTYQALIHELIGIKNNATTIGSNNFVLYPLLDEFYRSSMYMEISDVATFCEKEVKQVSADRENIRNMKDVGDKANEAIKYTKKSGFVVNHHNLLESIMKECNRRKLSEVGELEQGIACLLSESEAYKNLINMLNRDDIFAEDKVRLTCLFVLRFSPKKLSELKTLLHGKGVSNSQMEIIEQLLAYQSTIKNEVSTKTRSTTVKKGAVANIFSAFKPNLHRLLIDVSQGVIDENLFAICSPSHSPPGTMKPKEIIVFIVGGATYAEARVAAEFNKGSYPEGAKNVHAILGSNNIVNTKMFIESVKTAMR